MSGGFFRGTSADQDTRFSNKQAKLLKSQKFAPELENLVDMTKVKMDVMRPWVAKRVTELIGFEDEVLINFIVTLLEGKEVNGKEIQISLTGFMERNTGKFMKELWALLLSAQQNVSGVPQQFLDAKEEETKRKKAETDRMANEIKRKKEKEKQEVEQEKTKMGGDGARPRDKHTELELNVDDVGGSRNGRRRHDRDSQSPDSSYHSPSLRQKRSTSHSKSYSGARRRSRSISGAPPSRSRSISSERQYGSSPKRSVTPQRRHIFRRSPSPWRKSPHFKRRSTSHSRRRSPSPARYRVRSPRRHRSRSPLRRRSRSPARRRSRSPARGRSRPPIRRSSVRYRSRTPLRRRSSSPVRRWSPSPKRRGSPSPVPRRSTSPKKGRSLSPVRGRSPFFGRRRSPSPVRRRSPSPLRHRSPYPRQQSPSPTRRRYQRSPSTPHQQSVSPVLRRSSMHGRKRSFTPDRLRSPQELVSPSDTRHSSLSPVRKGSAKSGSSPIQSRGVRARRHEKYSPVRRASPKARIELPAENHEGTRFVERGPVVSLRSPQRDMLDRDDLRGKEHDLSPSMRKSPLEDASRGRSYSEERRSSSPHNRIRMAHPESLNPLRKAAGDKPYRESSGTSADAENNFSSREVGEYNYRSLGNVSMTSLSHKDSLNSSEVCGLIHGIKSQKTQLPTSDLIPDRMHHKGHRELQELSTTSKTTGLSAKGVESHDDGARAKDKKIARAYDTKGGYRLPEMEGLHKLSRKSEQNGSFDSPTKESDEYRVKVKEKRKHKKSHRQEVESDDYSSYDSYEERKEAKRRRKEEKKLKKEERRRRRGERCRRRDGSHPEKLRDAGSLSSDLARDHSEDESVRIKESRASYTQETGSEQKKLEIELREKALESLRAKKGTGN